MPQGLSNTRTVVLAGAAAAVVIVGTRALFDSEDLIEGSPLQHSGLKEACWLGRIKLQVDKIPPVESGCEASVIEWTGTADMQLSETFEVIGEVGEVGGVQVTKDVGLKTQLWFEEVAWDIRREEYSRSCGNSYGTGSDSGTRSITHDEFHDYGTLRERNVAGDIHYQVPTEYADYYKSGQYFLNLPAVCRGRKEPWTTPGRQSTYSFRVPVPCDFTDHFAGEGIVIGSDQVSTCKEEERFVEGDIWSDRKVTMEGALKCSFPDPEGNAPSRTHTTGGYTAEWRLERTTCVDTAFPVHPSDPNP